MLSLPIEGGQEEKPAHLKVMYIYDDRAQKLDFFLKAGKYNIGAIYDLVHEQVSRDRKEVKLGRKTLVFADLR
jgi:hypothetical protein